MAVTKLTHQVNIVNGTTTPQKQGEFAINFINWLEANWPGTDVLTKKNMTDVIAESALILNCPWNGTANAFAQVGGSLTTIKLVSSASAVDNFYNGNEVTIYSGQGSVSTRTIIGYVGSTKIATVDSAFPAIPIATSAYYIRDTLVPQWFKAAWLDASSYRYSIGSLNFTHAASDTDWCIVAGKDGSSSGYGFIALGIRQNTGGQVVYTELARFSDTVIDNTYLNNAETIVLTVMDKTGEYKFISKDYSAGSTLGAIFYNGIIRLDNPTDPTDVDAWMILGMNVPTLQRFTKAFVGEALGTPIEICADTLVPEGASFDKNIYSGKIPLGRVWGGSANLGMRGWTSWLAIVPQSYIVGNQLYTIGADTYYGLGVFDNQIQLPGGGANIGQRVLLKV